MFEAVRSLSNSKPKKCISVHNEKQHFIATDIDKAEAIKQYFECQFTNDDDPLEPFDGPGRSLKCPITSHEVQSVAAKLKNGNAAGPDSTPNEFLKYAGNYFYSSYAHIINRCFEENTYLNVILRSNNNTVAKTQKTSRTNEQFTSINTI